MSSSKEDAIRSFDPNNQALAKNNVFGLPFSEADADVVLVPVPWEVTVSYGGGTASGPEAILQASMQVDLYDPDLNDAWKHGIFLQEANSEWSKKSSALRAKAEKYIAFREDEGETKSDSKMAGLLDEVNQGCKWLKDEVRRTTSSLLKSNKIVGLVGGDHSTPLGYIEALSEIHKEFGILQLDAHCDLREAYEGFEFSHASIMYNALRYPQVKRLVQAGIRDYCQNEVDLIAGSAGRVKTFFDYEIKRALFQGESWHSVSSRIVSELPEKVYLSFDIDGLDPKLCPNTGTPVPGGFEFEQAVYLILEVVRSGRKIIGFDLNEVSPGDDEWDANVGARMLFKLCSLTLRSQRLGK